MASGRVFGDRPGRQGGYIALSAGSERITPCNRTSARQCGLALFDEFASREQRKHFDPLPFA